MTQRLTCIILILLSLNAWSQNATEVYLVKTMNGNVYEGIIVERNSAYVILNTKRIGEIRIFTEDIALIQIKGSASVATESVQEKVDSISNYGYQPPPNYLFSNNAFGLKAREGYYQNAWLFINQAEIAFSDYLNLGVGFIPIFGGDGWPLWLKPTVKIPVVKDKIQWSIGSTNMFNPDGLDLNLGVILTKMSFGNERSHIGIGMGKSYNDSEWDSGLLYNVNGVLRISKRASLAAELYGLKYGSLYLISYHQPLGDGSVILDIGTVGLVESGDNFWLPWIGVTVPFYVPPK